MQYAEAVCKRLFQFAKLEYHWNMKFRPRLLLFLLIFLPALNGAAGGRTVRTAKLPDHDLSIEMEKPPDVTMNNTAIEGGEGTDGGFLIPADPIQPAVQAGVETPGQPEIPAESRAEKVFRAMAKAYPDRTGDVEFIDGDWTIMVYGERFFYAEGRMLSESMRDKANSYDPLPFYNYPEELPPWTPPTAEESERMKEQEKRRQARPAKRSSQFYDALWRTHNRDESYEHVKQIRFLGHPVMVHYSILVQLSLVEEQISRLAKTNTAVRQWVSNIKSIDGWNWRNIAESESRSYHAYGAAIDFLPVSLGGLQTYWLWTSQHTPEWWTVSYAKRFQPPPEVIKAFESFGFIWGGKWRYFDTMHFEYRPEILAFNGIAQTDPRDLR